MYFMDKNIGMSPGRIVGFLHDDNEPLLQIRYEAPEWSDERYDLELGFDKVFENVDAFTAIMGSRRKEKTYQSTEGNNTLSVTTHSFAPAVCVAADVLADVLAGHIFFCVAFCCQ